MAKHGGPRVVKGKTSHGSHNSFEIEEADGGFFVVDTKSGKRMNSEPLPSRAAAQQQIKALQAAAGAGKAEGSAVKIKSKTGHNKKKNTTGHLG